MMLLDQTLGIYALSFLSIGLVNILQNTQAFWTVILAYYFNGEAFHRIEGIGIVACFVGVIIICLSDPQNEQAAEATITNQMRLASILIMLFIACNDSSLNVMARTMKDVHYTLLQFWFGAISMIILTAYVFIEYLWTRKLPPLLLYDE